MAQNTQAQLAHGLDPQADLRVAIANKPHGALTSDSAGAILAAVLKFDVHDTIVTSRSVLGYTTGLRFLEILDGPGSHLQDQPIQIQE